MSDMSQNNGRSLLERAAEAYDFGAALRTPAPEPVPAPEPTPAPAPVKKVRALQPPPPPQPRPAHGVAAIDRVALAEGGFIVPEAPDSAIAEEFRLIKHRLIAEVERDDGDPRRRALLIASAQPKAGKTFCAVNLALSLAGEKDVEVLLVDGDFIKPDALALLGVHGGPGLVDALADPSIDPETLVIRTDVPGLSVLPAGAKANNIPELLASEKSREVLAKLIAGDKRRITLFDSPPALMASHATMLAGHVGRALVVVRADHTTEADLRETIGLLQGCEISLILNGAGLAVTGRKYGAYDGYGHDQ